jgi:hypothetical protein
MWAQRLDELGHTQGSGATRGVGQHHVQGTVVQDTSTGTNRPAQTMLLHQKSGVCPAPSKLLPPDHRRCCSTAKVRLTWRIPPYSAHARRSSALRWHGILILG